MAKLIIKTRYANTPNNLLNNKNLSLSAKGLYGYLQSKPDNWDFSIAGMASQCKEGEKAIRTAIKELETEGWLIRYNYQGEGGKWTCEYELQDIQLSDNQRKILKPYSPHGDTVKGVPLVGIPATGTQSKPYSSKKEKDIYIDDSNSTTKPDNKKSKNSTSKIKQTESQNPFQNELPEIIEHWNYVYSFRKIYVSNGWKDNYAHWRNAGYSLEQIKEAISNSTDNSYWCDKIDLIKLFRTKDQGGQNVDRIQEMLNTEIHRVSKTNVPDNQYQTTKEEDNEFLKDIRNRIKTGTLFPNID